MGANQKLRWGPEPPPVEGCVWVGLTKGQWTLLDEADTELDEAAWHSTKGLAGHYACRTVPGSGGYEKLHRVIAQRMGLTIDGLEVDHINGDPLDNRRANLRVATTAENQRNASVRSDNSSGTKGVGWYKPKQMWQAYIQIGGKLRHLGFFSVLEEAISARKTAEVQIHGEFRRKAENDNGRK